MADFLDRCLLGVLGGFLGLTGLVGLFLVVVL